MATDLALDADLTGSISVRNLSERPYRQAKVLAGEDGLDAIRVVTAVATRLLRPGGLLCFEHADVQGESAPAVVTASRAVPAVRDHVDLAGRPRFVPALRRTAGRMAG